MTALCLQWIHMNTGIPPRFDLISFHSFHLKFPMSCLRTAWDHIHGQGAQANAALNLNMRLMTTARVTRSWLLWTCQTLQGHRDSWVHHCHQPTQEIPLSSQVVIILSIRFPNWCSSRKSITTCEAYGHSPVCKTRTFDIQIRVHSQPSVALGE